MSQSPNNPTFWTVTGSDFGRSIRWARERGPELGNQLHEINHHRAKYAEECEKRWAGWALRDAKANWSKFREIHPTLLEAMRQFRRDPFMTDMNDKCHNEDGTLTAFLWKLQVALEPDRSCLHPLLDFEETFQKVFLKRGLIIYCSLILRQLEAASEKAGDELFGLKIVEVPGATLPAGVTGIMVSANGSKVVLKEAP